MPLSGRPNYTENSPEAVKARREAQVALRTEKIANGWRTGAEIPGTVNLEPFSKTKVRKKSWYLDMAKYALKFIQNRSKIILEFPGKSITDLIPDVERVISLNYLMETVFSGRRRVGRREFDRAAKEILSEGDAYSSTGGLQAVLAYKRYEENAALHPEITDHHIKLAAIDGYRHLSKRERLREERAGKAGRVRRVSGSRETWIIEGDTFRKVPAGEEDDGGGGETLPTGIDLTESDDAETTPFVVHKPGRPYGRDAGAYIQAVRFRKRFPGG